MTHLTWLLAQAENNDRANALAGGIFGLFGCCFFIVWLAFLVLIIGGMWKIFSKAGQPGWAAIVPFYNAYVLCLVAGKPGWWFILLFIPIVNIVISILVWVAIAERFGKGVGYVVGLILLPMVFIPMLGWGPAQYRGGPQGGVPTPPAA